MDKMYRIDFTICWIFTGFLHRSTSESWNKVLGKRWNRMTGILLFVAERCFYFRWLFIPVATLFCGTWKPFWGCDCSCLRKCWDEIKTTSTFSSPFNFDLFFKQNTVHFYIGYRAHIFEKKKFCFIIRRHKVGFVITQLIVGQKIVLIGVYVWRKKPHEIS